MDRTLREVLTSSRMAFPAGLGEVLLVGRRCGITGWLYVVRSMASGTVRDARVPVLVCHTVVAVDIRTQPMCRQAVPFLKLHVLMALRACSNHVGRIDHRGQRRGSLYRVLSVAISTYRGILDSLGQSFPMYALLVDLIQLVVALPAGFRHMRLVDGGFHVPGCLYVVDSVAIGAYSRGLIDILGMHAGLV